MGLPSYPLNNFVTFVDGLDNYRKFRSFRKFRNFRSFRNFRWAFLVTHWINFVDFVGGLGNYRQFCSFRNYVQSWTLLKQEVGSVVFSTLNVPSVEKWTMFIHLIVTEQVAECQKPVTLILGQFLAHFTLEFDKHNWIIF